MESSYLDCDISIFDDLTFDKNKRHNYDVLKSKYPISTIMYKNLDNYIDELALYHNKLLNLL